MISPFTGGNATLKFEKREMEYRKEKYSYVAQYYEDDETHECFTTEEMDEANLAQIYNQYRVAHSIPFVDEIVSLRLRYGLSASKMSVILGFGPNQYRQYEEGYMPSETNGKVIMVCQSPQTFETYVRNSRLQLGDKDYEKILSKVQAVMDKPADMREKLVFGENPRGVTTGFAPQALERLHQMLVFFINKCNDVFNTKMNKLLFYSDFYNYQQHAQSISGLAYRAIQYGPVPVHWDRVYSLFDDISQEIVAFGDGITGTKLVTTSETDLSAFTEKEQQTMEKVAAVFRDMSSCDISRVSHKEDAWLQHVGRTDLISFDSAFKLKAF